MKRLFVLIVALVATSSLAFAYAGALDYFSAKADGDGISLEWKSGTEAGIKSYTIERSDIKGNDFTEIGIVSAVGSNSYYKFHDTKTSAAGSASGNVYKPQSDLFKYRLHINLSGGEISYSQTVSVTKPSSGVKRTWGMIKEMFH